MVQTRAQAKRERGSDVDTEETEDEGSTVIGSVSSDADGSDDNATARHGGSHAARRSHTPVGRVGRSPLSGPRAGPATPGRHDTRAALTPNPTASASPAGTATPAAAATPEVERLGRGCRVSHYTTTLDETYLAASLRRKTGQPHPSPAQRAGSAEDGAFTVTRRYPLREAAKRAMESLRTTLSNAHGAAGGWTDDSEEGNSNSLGAFNFRHHPELAEEIKQKHARRKLRDRKRRRHGSSSSSSGSSDEDDDDEDDDDDASTSSSEAEDDKPPAVVAPVAKRPRGRPPRSMYPASRIAAGVPQAAAATAAPARNGTASSVVARAAPMAAPRRARLTEEAAVSIDSSISDASMREESVERAAQQDRRAAPTPSSSSDSGDGDANLPESQRRRAVRHASASVMQNININHYLADAVGVADPRRIRHRQLDRRYRALMFQEEDARAAAEGYAGLGASAGGGEAGSAGGAPAGASATTTANGALGDILPLRIDDDISFDSVGGLPEHIVTLREMVLLPLLYPDLFQRLDLKAPRGVLFVGPPGTGKTLMARALANEGSRYARVSGAAGCAAGGSPAPQPHQRITFFVRKGADMLSKWVGESERQLKLLFEEAKRLQPSIVFFDEVDGLAPTRHAKAEQTQAALVSTLLALLDGLEDRGQVVVIGATNRPDTLDPALRRPGRFDRELVFPLPDAAARRHILAIQLAKKATPAGTRLLDDLVEMTEGYSGADLGALCTEASLHRLRTALPQLYLSSQRLLVPHEVEAAQLHVRTEDFYAAAQLMQPSLRRTRGGGGGTGSARGATAADGLLDPYVEVLLRGTRDATLAALAPSWSLVDKALRAGSRDCRDMASAVRALCAVPIPQPPRPCLLVLTESPTPAPSADASRHSHQQQQQQQRALQLHHLSISLLKGLPRLPQLTVHLPQLCWDDAEASAWRAGASLAGFANGNKVSDYLGVGGGGYGLHGGGGGGGADFVHLRQVVESVRQCSPCVVHLSGVEEWLEEGGGDGARGGGRVPPLAGGDESDLSASGAEDEPGKATGANGAAPLSRRLQRQVQLFRYYLNMLADTDVIFVLPCASARACAWLLGTAADETPALDDEQQQHHHHHNAAVLADSCSPSSPILSANPPEAVRLTRCSPRRQGLHPQFSIVQAAVAAAPLPADLRHFVEYVYRIIAMTLQLHGPALPESGAATRPQDPSGAALVVDPAPLASSLSAANLRARRRADRAHRRRLWSKVEYRRLQLRHVLMKWVTQYLSPGKYKLLASADLDLATDDPLLKSWRHHTRHSRLGLQDILEKVEDESYVCLSQFNDDVDQLVHNVRSFFRTRAVQDQRYRLKALDLKQTALLNMYKMNRAVVRFCEETRDVAEPSSSEDDGGGDGGAHVAGVAAELSATALVAKDADPALLAEQSRRAMSFSQRHSAGGGGSSSTAAGAASTHRRPPRRYYGERRRRRRGRPRKAAKTEPSESAADAHSATAAAAGHKVVPVKEDEGERDEDEEVEEEQSHTSRSHTDGSDDGEAEGVARSARGAAADGSRQVSTHASDVVVLADAASARAWACELLASFTYTRLSRVFKSMMRGLEVEVREVEQRGGLCKVVAGEATTSSELTPEVYAVDVFKQLLLAAVGE